MRLSRRSFFIMPFGRYKGEYLEDLPESYLYWLWNNCDLKGQLYTEVERLLYEEDDDYED